MESSSLIKDRATEFDDYWAWKKSASKHIITIEKKLDELKTKSALLETSAESCAQTIQARLPSPGMEFWLANRKSYSTLRAAEQRLAMLGYDVEVAIARAYFERKAEQSLQSLNNDPSLKSVWPPIKCQLRWFYAKDDRCSGGIAPALDRVGASVTALQGDAAYEISTELSLRFCVDGLVMDPTLSAALCASQNPNLPAEDEILWAVDNYLAEPNNWQLINLAIPTGTLIKWAPYMEILGENISVLSKLQRGRHAPIPLLARVPDGWDLSISASLDVIRNVLLDSLAKQNLSREFHPRPYTDIAVALEGGPYLGSGAIVFVIGIYFKTQGGGAPIDEWHIDIAGKATLQAEFVYDGGGKGHFSLKVVSDVSDVSAQTCSTYTGACAPWDSVAKFAAGKALDSYLRTMNLPRIDVEFKGAQSVGCQILNDRAVFLLKMAVLPVSNQIAPRVKSHAFDPADPKTKTLGKTTE